MGSFGHVGPHLVGIMVGIMIDIMVGIMVGTMVGMTGIIEYWSSNNTYNSRYTVVGIMVGILTLGLVYIYIYI